MVFGMATVEVQFTFMKFGKLRSKTKTMCKLQNKSLFGEISLLYNGKRTASIKADEACSLLVISNSAFRKYMKN